MKITSREISPQQIATINNDNQNFDQWKKEEYFNHLPTRNKGNECCNQRKNTQRR